MEPAYHITLTAIQKRQITEIAAIQAQIDWTMRLTVQLLLAISPSTAQSILGSTAMRTNSEIWIKVVREKHKSIEAKEWAEYAFYQTAALSAKRNDFLHTIFGIYTKTFGRDGKNFGAILGHTRNKLIRTRRQTALKVRSSQTVDLADIPKVRNEAAHLSIVFAHIHALAMEADPQSPWRRRLLKPLLLQFQKEELERNLMRERQQRSSLEKDRK